MRSTNFSQTDTASTTPRKFGVVVGGVFIVVGVFSAIFSQHVWGWALLVLGIFMLAMGVIFPKVLIPVERIWMRISLALGWVMTRVILVTVYFCVITPVATLLALMKRRPLRMRPKDDAHTYWDIREKIGDKKRYYERQF